MKNRCIDEGDGDGGSVGRSGMSSAPGPRKDEDDILKEEKSSV